MRRLALVVLALLLAACGSEAANPRPSATPSTGLSARVNAAVLRADGVASIRAGCDAEQKTWECYWTSFADDGGGRLAVTLSLPKSMSGDERAHLASESGFTMFATIGSDVPELDNVSFRDEHGLEIGQSERGDSFTVR